MGTSAVNHSEQLLRQHPRGKIKSHFRALVKLQHFSKRKQVLQKEADDDVERIRSSLMGQIALKKQQTVRQLGEGIQRVEGDDEYLQRIQKKGTSIEEYEGLMKVEQAFSSLEDRMEQSINTIKDEMQANNSLVFDITQKQIQPDLLQFQETKTLPKQEIQAFFVKMKLSYSEQVKLVQAEIQTQLKEELSTGYYKQRLTDLLTEESYSEINKLKPKQLNSLPLFDEIPDYLQKKGWCLC